MRFLRQNQSVAVACLLLYCPLPAICSASAGSKRARRVLVQLEICPRRGRGRAGVSSYQRVQQRLAQGWNTWDVNSVTTQVLLPEGLAIHVGLRHNATLFGDPFLGDTFIGELAHGAQQVVPGSHSWDGSYTDLRISWRGHLWRIQSAREGNDLLLLATPLPSTPVPTLPATDCFLC